MTRKVRQKKSLVIVYTGSGKGKTTAALGLALRAIGAGKKVAFIQFIKGSWKTSETESIKRLAPDFEFFRMGKGFVRIFDDRLDQSVHVAAAKEALEYAKKLLFSKKVDVLVLDEILVAVRLRLIRTSDVLSLIEMKPDRTTIVLTGRNAPKQLIQIADCVTEMKQIKHPFTKGIRAIHGIDY